MKYISNFFLLVFILTLPCMDSYAGIYDAEVNFVTEQRNTFVKEANTRLLNINSVNHYLERIMENFDSVQRQLEHIDDCVELEGVGKTPLEFKRMCLFQKKAKLNKALFEMNFYEVYFLREVQSLKEHVDEDPLIKDAIGTTIDDIVELNSNLKKKIESDVKSIGLQIDDFNRVLFQAQFPSLESMYKRAHQNTNIISHSYYILNFASKTEKLFNTAIENGNFNQAEEIFWATAYLTEKLKLPLPSDPYFSSAVKDAKIFYQSLDKNVEKMQAKLKEVFGRDFSIQPRNLASRGLDRGHPKETGANERRPKLTPPEAREMRDQMRGARTDNAEFRFEDRRWGRNEIVHYKAEISGDTIKIKEFYRVSNKAKNNIESIGKGRGDSRTLERDYEFHLPDVRRAVSEPIDRSLKETLLQNNPGSKLKFDRTRDYLGNLNRDISNSLDRSNNNDLRDLQATVNEFENVQGDFEKKINTEIEEFKKNFDQVKSYKRKFNDFIAKNLGYENAQAYASSLTGISTDIGISAVLPGYVILDMFSMAIFEETLIGQDMSSEMQLARGLVPVLAVMVSMGAHKSLLAAKMLMQLASSSSVIAPIIGSVKKVGRRVPQAALDILEKNSPEAKNAAANTWEKVIEQSEKWGLKNPKDIKNNSKLIEGYGNFFEKPDIKDASNINKEFLRLGQEPPYLDGTKVFETKTVDNVPDLVRVHGSDNQASKWVMKAEDVDNLNAQEIAKKFNLPHIPTHISRVELPLGTNLRIGAIGVNKFGTSTGSIQYEILRPDGVRIPDDWFDLIGELK